ncbi:MAG: hypothetical protein M9926_08070 [Lentimicrobium sp.]|uniref:hypothetical protein n=1 Tax=Lentimicrobium sp. TaxID=2034841 RepID=UPI0025ED818C|nr:hypothetical protein [Lentimicrobium sp.]MCO5256702.1 hypothetical protein [Lentimicrobium sp.]
MNRIRPAAAIIKVFISFLMILLLGFYFSVNFNYRHRHIVDGMVMVHSHPFSDDNPDAPFKQHQHQPGSLFLVANDNVLASPPVYFQSQPVVFLPLDSKPVLKDISLHSQVLLIGNGLRAPPAGN